MAIQLISETKKQLKSVALNQIFTYKNKKWVRLNEVVCVAFVGTNLQCEFDISYDNMNDLVSIDYRDTVKTVFSEGYERYISDTKFHYISW